MTRTPEPALLAWLETLAADADPSHLGATVRPATLGLGPTIAAPSAEDEVAPPTRRAHPATDVLPRIGLASAGGGGAADADLELCDVLGEGGMGRVYEARQRSLGRRVAVKVVREARPDVAASLLREARLSGALEHPGVVPVHALGVGDDGLPVLVMKRVEGTSWQDLLDDPEHAAWSTASTLPTERLLAHLEILAHVASTLAFAHARGILHRDVKPANVLVGRFGEVYLVDWGIALDLANRDAEPIAPVGTPLFLAPEMVLGDPREVDERTDVYLLGATLHAVLSRAPRHGGTTMREVLAQATRSEPVSYGPEVPSELAALANAATSRDKEARPQTALAFRDRLVEYFEHRGSIALTARGDALLAEARERAPGATAPVERAALRSTLAEARFAYGQAIAQWSGNDAARRGLEEALERAVDVELEDRAVGAARSLLLASTSERPELLARIEEAERELARREEEHARLRRRAQRHSPRRMAGMRNLLVGLLAVGGSATTFALRHTRMGEDPFPTWRSPLYPLAFCVAFAPILWLGRRALRESAFNRNLVSSILLTLVLASALRLVALRVSTPIVHVMIYEILLFAGLMGFLALFVARPFWGAFVVAIAATAGAVLVPGYIEAFYVLTPLALAVASYWAGRRDDAASAAATSPPGDA